MHITKSNWKQFLLHTAIRALKTFFQTFVAVIGTTALISQVDWKIVLSTSGLAAIVSIATSFATGLPEVTPVLDEKEGDDNGNV